MIQQYQVTKYYTLSFNKKGKEFKDAHESYADTIAKGATMESMLKQVIFFIDRFGAERMIEGIGYVSVNGKIQGEPFSGIDVTDAEPDAEIEKS